MTDPIGTPALDELDELLSAARALSRSPALVRATLARELAGPMRAALGHVTDEAITSAINEVVGTRRRSHREVAEHLGVGLPRINKAVTDYRRWLATRVMSELP